MLSLVGILPPSRSRNQCFRLPAMGYFTHWAAAYEGLGTIAGLDYFLAKNFGAAFVSNVDGEFPPCPRQAAGKELRGLFLHVVTGCL